MSSFTTIGQSIGTNLLGTGQSVAKSISGHPELVQFLDSDTNSTIVQFDCVMSENHQRESPATSFPLEDGSNISDHIFVSPFELMIQGVVTDTPIGSAKQLITEAFAGAIAVTLPPLGLAAAGTAYGLWLADQKTKSPSKTTFNKLLRLQAGDPTASPPTPPKPLKVRTRLRTYDNMVIRSLSVPRDATMGDALAFQITLTQLLIVKPQSVNISVVLDKALAAKKGSEGEQDLQEDDGFSAGYTAEKRTKAALLGKVVGGTVNGK